MLQHSYASYYYFYYNYYDYYYYKSIEYYIAIFRLKLYNAYHSWS